MVSFLIFGDSANPARRLDSLQEMQPGDILFWISSSTGKAAHVVVALETPNDIRAFHITDGNHGETVVWPDRQSQYGRDNLTAIKVIRQTSAWRSGPAAQRTHPAQETARELGTQEVSSEQQQNKRRGCTMPCGPFFHEKEETCPKTSGSDPFWYAPGSGVCRGRYALWPYRQL